MKARGESLEVDWGILLGGMVQTGNWMVTARMGEGGR